MAFASVCVRPTDEECFNDVERRAEPVSPFDSSQAARPPASATSGLRSRVPAWTPQRREAAISTFSQQSTATDEIRLRDTETRRWSRRTQSDTAAPAGDFALDEPGRGLRRRDFGAAGSSDGELRRAEHGADETNAAGTPGRRTGIGARGALGLIRVYQRLISPSLGNVCRYAPSCSHYTYEAIECHGLVKGAWLGLRRFLRCGPWGGRGYDPVPD